jgi:hypothetical protein
MKKSMMNLMRQEELFQFTEVFLNLCKLLRNKIEVIFFILLKKTIMLEALVTIISRKVYKTNNVNNKKTHLKLDILC